jgi:hypothetical protein
MSEEIKFYIDDLPAPFDFYWELAPVENKIHAPTPTDPYAFRMERSWKEWSLRMVSTISDDRTEATTITSLTDEVIRAMAKAMVNKYVARNRAKALEEGPVRLVGNDDS